MTVFLSLQTLDDILDTLANLIANSAWWQLLSNKLGAFGIPINRRVSRPQRTELIEAIERQRLQFVSIPLPKHAGFKHPLRTFACQLVVLQGQDLVQEVAHIVFACLISRQLLRNVVVHRVRHIVESRRESERALLTLAWERSIQRTGVREDSWQCGR
jgi:hypothetical protein